MGLWLYNCGFDFYDYIPRYVHRHTMEFFARPGYLWYYPAPAIFVHVPFYAFVLKTRNVMLGYYVFLAVVILLTLAATILFGRALIHQGLSKGSAVGFCTGTFLCSYPIYFASQRGNIEALTWMLLGVGVWAFVKRHPLLSAVLLGIAASIKIYPGLFLALFLSRWREWRWAAVGLAIFGVTTFVGLWYLDPHVLESAAWVAEGIKQWTRDYTKSYPNYPWDHAIFGQVRLLAKPATDFYQHDLKLYYVLATPIACALAWRVRRFPITNRVVFLSSAAVTLPPASFDYSLCMLYIPLALLAALAMAAARASVKVPGLTFIMVLLAIVTAPEMFAMTLHVQWVPASIKCLSLLALAGASVWWPLEVSSGIALNRS